MTRLILSLYKKRRIKVITSFGLTNEFEAKNRLDQGKVILPLAQRIFYDLLFCAVNRAKYIGYKITTNQPTDLACNKTRKLVHQQAMLAYADDTTWIVRSKISFRK